MTVDIANLPPAASAQLRPSDEPADVAAAVASASMQATAKAVAANTTMNDTACEVASFPLSQQQELDADPDATDDSDMEDQPAVDSGSNVNDGSEQQEQQQDTAAEDQEQQPGNARSPARRPAATWTHKRGPPSPAPAVVKRPRRTAALVAIFKIGGNDALDREQ